MIYLVGLKQDKNIAQIVVNKIFYNTFSVDFSKYNSVIITSKNAVKALEFNKIKIAKHIKIFSIGLSTTKYLNELSYNVFYTGCSGHSSEFKYEILDKLESKVLYLKAKEIKSNLDEFLLSKNIDIEIINAYKNIDCECEFKINKDDILIFLAPSSVRSFFCKNKAIIADEQRLICIGRSTEDELKKYTKNKIYIPQYPNIDECIKLAKEMK
ncbi:uroporphyrinogen-III synthase [Campylobacter canadensis]|uniref:Uroporphyrinogen-III synthase n=1 Tax=Campylobacter canadensis TaxID=449520 RepID=A0ABS7WR39_9BACT|nr:uroporphyrinogen-III synthase [Campylobacter canadensis]MBZ7987203.1 uroporphyrinogen-III synthase [Campylobacter canadensis]MBZ7994445.1 uroporphyrinogen-III synthase [Campylobacter canadensis]MBZ7996468.1 uroporphyrinogen-III synthase [Campylobacter canadensis]MBZ7998173.1 uroporphyrinogen-III synthase [Campylobacter canadensis]MBZ7999840.1 uroporphyrinogen-III synthase [Campylobacter canadensis]